ncbi:kelch repeat-containing protein [Cyclospora cayetanensis]|uniref:tRNA(Phe) 7-[(3-amino-3-carboxypropyl)-4-demethylwyosine(37)-N(4)]-methyltransferase n=1 Tax=Cyclospora cayetanensis TaxID=88456 RepID=A0A1D3D542_9EIME|nr:kelch repeat-containing protein [Cyclospora cayetanensis]
MEDFPKRKQRILRGLIPEGESPTSQELACACDEGMGYLEGNTPKQDKSLKGSVDALLVPICAYLNAHPEYVTTSCCSGRITAYQQAHTSDGKRVKSGGRLVFVSHEAVDLSAAERLLTEILEGSRHYPEKRTGKADTERSEKALPALSHTDLKLEPVILHVESATAPAALALLRAAIAAGLRESGILSLGKRNIVAIRGSQRLEAPLTLGLRGSLQLPGLPRSDEGADPADAEGEQLLVTSAYFSSLLLLCNEKLKCNERQIGRLYEVLRKNLSPEQILSPDAHDFQEVRGLQDFAWCACLVLRGRPSSGLLLCRVVSRSKAFTLICSDTTTHIARVQLRSLDSRSGGASHAFVGVRERELLKAVKSALEDLGVYDKTRKVQQLHFEEFDSTEQIELTPPPPPNCPWLGLLPVKSDLCDGSLSQELRAALVTSAADGSVSLFSYGSGVPPQRRRKQSIAECLDGLLRAACTALPGGDALVRRAEQLRKERLSGGSPAPAACPAARGDLLIKWPEKFERVGNIILLPRDSLIELHQLLQIGWETVGATQARLLETSLWRAFCKELRVTAVGLQAPVEGRMRQSQARLVYGDSGLTGVKENGITYTLDVTQCMFASGNGTERLRFRESIQASKGPPETVVDLFCGIGYFSLLALASVPPTRLKKLYACDINPTALKFFHMSLAPNRVDPCRVTFLLCDSCSPLSGSVATAPSAVDVAVECSPAAAAARLATATAVADTPVQHKALSRHSQNSTETTATVPAALMGIADRISLGLIPSSEEAWPTAVALLNGKRGGTLHVHGVAPLEAAGYSGQPLPSALYAYTDAATGEQLVTASVLEATGASGESIDGAMPQQDKSRPTGVGGNCKLGASLQFAQHALRSMAELVKTKIKQPGEVWAVYVHHVEKVKSYAPKLFHFVVDITACPLVYSASICNRL